VERPILGGRYELGPPIGSGGFGTVFRARDRRTGAELAVKLVPPSLGSSAAAERLRREGQLLRRITSRHVAKVFDSGDDGAGVWLVTELVDGAPLTLATLGRPLLPHEVLRVARGLLEGLAAVHAAGIVHGDVKPSNVLVPVGDKALDGAKLVDFGLARVVARSEIALAVGDAVARDGMVIGTARYMAPEVLSGADPSMRADLYAVGLVLFELLDEGPLFPVGDVRAQLRARVSTDPDFRERVPPPLSDVLARMLAWDAAARWPDAGAAHAAVADLDTAPVALLRDDSPPSPPRVSLIAPPQPARSVPPAARGSNALPARPISGSPSIRPSSEPRRSFPPVLAIPRLTSLPADGIVALRETLRHLDLPMLDALARRERGNPTGRIARAVALALRLELDAAALILEPLAMQSDVARAIGAAVVAPRARRVTRARVDTDHEDRWVETIDPELGAMLAVLAASLASSDDAERDARRCSRSLARLDALAAKEGLALGADATRVTLRITNSAVRVRRGELDRGVGSDLVAPLVVGSDGRGEAPFHAIVRGLAVAMLFGNEPRASVELERAERIAAETGTTLLDASAATALGMHLASRSPSDERGLRALERAGTLLAHGDAPSLEHEAQHHRATALIARGRWGDAIVHLRSARTAAHDERAGDRELLSASIEVLAGLAIGDLQAAYESAAILGESRLASANGRTAALAWTARALTSLSASDREGAEDALAAAKTCVRREDRDAYVVVELVSILFDADRGDGPDLMAAIAELDSVAEGIGFDAFYWFDLLAAVISRMPDPETSSRMGDALVHLGPVVGPQSRLARSRHAGNVVATVP